jgi:hypothetical protein
MVIPPIADDRRFLTASIIVLSAYIVILAVSPKRVFWIPDEGAKWMVMHSTRIDGDLRYFVDFPAQRVDKEYAYLPHRSLFPVPTVAADGELYLGFETPVVFPLISELAFRLFGVVGIYFLPLVGGWLMAVVAGVLAEVLRPGVGAATVLVVGLATPVFFYSMLFWEHTVAGSLGLLAAGIVALSPPASLGALLASLIGLLAAMTFRMEMLALAGAVILAWAVCGWRTRRRTAAAGAPSRSRRWIVVAVLASMALAAGVLLDAALTIRHRKILETLPERISRGFGGLWESPWAFPDIFIHRSLVAEAPKASEEWVVAASVGALLCLAAAFTRRAVVEGTLLVVGGGLLVAFSLSLLTTSESYRTLHGVIPIAPFVVLAGYAWSGSRVEGRSHALTVLSAIALAYALLGTLAISTMYLERGRLMVALEWGQRYLLMLYPIAALLSVVGAARHWRSARPLWLRRAFATVFAAMVLVGGGFQVRGQWMLNDTRTGLSRWEEAMRIEGPIVTDVWWLPAAFAVLYTEHEMYYVSKRTQVAEWAERAAAVGLSGFTFVGFKPVEVEQFGSEALQLAPLQPTPVDGMYLTRLLIEDMPSS